MKIVSLVSMTFAAVLLLTGCGHNAIQYGDGIGFDVGAVVLAMAAGCSQESG